MAYANPADARAYEKNRPNREERLKALREKRAAQYLDRKLRQVCVDCEAKLGPDDGVKCELCAGRDSVTKVTYAATAKGRRARKRAQRAYVERRVKRDVCAQCLTPRKKWPKPTELQLKRQRVEKPKHCPTCRQKMTDNTREYRRRLKRDGVVRMSDARKAKRAEKLRELRGKLYIPFDELVERTSVRILRALLAHDWIASDALFDVMGVPEFDTEDNSPRDRYQQRLSVLTRGGFIERRDPPERRRDRIGLRRYDYRITKAGRDELARLWKRTEAA